MGGTAFTVGIPVLNEEAILVPNTERLLHFLDGLGRDYEIIIGSNGSTDSTTALGVDLSRRFPRVSFFHLPEKGVGLAFKEFVRRAKHPFLVSVDMDLSVDIGFVATAVELLETHDIVVGSKKMGNQNRTLFRRIGSDSFLQATRLLLGLTYDDYSIAFLGADGNLSNKIDAGDYTYWRSQFGKTLSGAGSGSDLSSSGVPEPSTIALLSCSGLFLASSRPRRRPQ